MKKSSILIDVVLDAEKKPAQISWHATDTTGDQPKNAKAMMISFWDGAEKTALRMDLWTNEMMVDEMADFFYQTLMTMADTYKRATHHEELSGDIKKFAREFYTKFREQEMKQNKL